jgi:hypothetical protein
LVEIVVPLLVIPATTVVFWQRDRVADRDDPDSPARIMHRRRRFWLPSRCPD